jgi:hypothetical protein
VASASDLLHPPARAGGAVLATATGVLAALRRQAKPLHPHGVVLDGVLRCHGGEQRSGVHWLDEPGEDRALVRLSRAVGLPPSLPDVHGLAIRVLRDPPGDLLLATTGRGVPARFLLTWHRAGHEHSFTSLLPYRTVHGPVVVGASRTHEDDWELAWATPTSGWVSFARLEVGEPHDDRDVSFDPLRHELPGLGSYGWVRRLREPAYLTARRSSGRRT